MKNEETKKQTWWQKFNKPWSEKFRFWFQIGTYSFMGIGLLTLCYLSFQQSPNIYVLTQFKFGFAIGTMFIMGVMIIVGVSQNLIELFIKNWKLKHSHSLPSKEG